jgi:uncharacterized repeat protein (TIGR03803 family)
MNENRQHQTKRIVSALGKLNCGKRTYAVFALCAGAAIALPAQTLSTLHSFDGTDGAGPVAGLVQATNGDLYGTTGGGGADGGGTVFKMTTAGTLTTLYRFCSQPVNGVCTDGAGPEAGLVQATNGDFYGTTVGGGAKNFGTIFKITPSGTLTTLYSFCSQSGCTDGYVPYAGLVQATNGDFYGTTWRGGVNGEGTVFTITPSGTLTTLYSFCSQGGGNCTDGELPYAGLVQATNGDFYGTTQFGGANVAPNGASAGTIFKITPSGTLTTLYSFCSQSGCTDGYVPDAGLVQATNGDFYGTTWGGGVNGEGTVLRITPSGMLTTLYNFCSQPVSGVCTDGLYPTAGVVRATNGDFYGTTGGGGTNGEGGTVFKITPSGTLTTLYSFCSRGGASCTDGEGPTALVQDTNGDFYGATGDGGANTNINCPSGCGTVFSLSIGLGPFVKTQPTSGTVGKFVEILGTNLTGATIVTFNGTPATFKVVSRYLITTSVPSGATNGKVQVITPSRTLSSNVPFRVP